MSTSRGLVLDGETKVVVITENPIRNIYTSPIFINFNLKQLETFLDNLGFPYELFDNFLFIERNTLSYTALNDINDLTGNIYPIECITANPFGKGLFIIFNAQGKEDYLHYLTELEDAP